MGADKVVKDDVTLHSPDSVTTEDSDRFPARPTGQYRMYNMYCDDAESIHVPVTQPSSSTLCSECNGPCGLTCVGCTYCSECCIDDCGNVLLSQLCCMFTCGRGSNRYIRTFSIVCFPFFALLFILSLIVDFFALTPILMGAFIIIPILLCVLLIASPYLCSKCLTDLENDKEPTQTSAYQNL